MPDPTVPYTSIEIQSETSFYTLRPLQMLGQDSLQPFGAVRDARLCELESYFENAPDDITIRKADDLFERAKAVEDEYGPIAAKATLARALFDLVMEDSDRPSKVGIQPPDTITIQFRKDIGRILAWLENCRFRVKRAVKPVTV